MNAAAANAFAAFLAASIWSLPGPAPSPATAPAAPSRIEIVGQVIDLESGYVVFASGDAFKLAPDAPIVDDGTGEQPRFALLPGIYANAVLDVPTASVTMVRVSEHPLTGGISPADVLRGLVAAASPHSKNPDLRPVPSIYTSRLSAAVVVTVTVEVPPETPYTDDIYIATDSSGWNAQAIKMQRIDGRHFRIKVDLSGGTEFHFLFTRGSWQTVERDRSGLKREARTLSVPGGDSMVVELIVYRWADDP